jgi:hypothetical protein
MSIISIYLVVLVLALLLGNGILHMTRNPNAKTRRQAVRQRQEQLVHPAERLTPPPENTQENSQASSEEADASQQLFESKLKALDELTRMAHGRLDDLEQDARDKHARIGGLEKDVKEKHVKIASLEQNVASRPATIVTSDSEEVSKEVAELWEDNARNLEALKTQSVQLFGDINEKIGKLDHFRANTLIELKGIKEVAVDMKGALKGFQPELLKKAEDNLTIIESELDLIKRNLDGLQKNDAQQGLLGELDGIQSRLDKLHTFKTNTEVELKALKEIVVGLKNTVEKSLTEKGTTWVKGDGKAKNFDQYMEKFRRVSLGMKNMDY